MSPQDERWEFLRVNIESLHESVREAHARADRLDAQERVARRAFLTYLRGMNAAMQRYLEVLDRGDDQGPNEGEEGSYDDPPGDR